MGLFDFLFKSHNENTPSEIYSSLEGRCIRLNGHLRAMDMVNFKCSISPEAEYTCEDQIEQQLESLKRIEQKADRYIRLGGDPRLFVGRFEVDADRMLEKAEFLLANGVLGRQREWSYKSIDEIKTILDSENIELSKLKALINQLNEFGTANTNLDNLSGIEFEILCQKLLTKIGYDVLTTKATGDGGIDIIATNNQPLTSGKYIVQCKRYSENVGEPILRDLYGVVMSENANKGILITTSSFTKSAKSFAEGKQLELVDGNTLHHLLDTYGILSESKIKNKTVPSPLVYMNDYNSSEFLKIQSLFSSDPTRCYCNSIQYIYDYINRNIFSIPDNKRELGMDALNEIARIGILYCKPILVMGIDPCDKNATYRYYMTLLAEAHFSLIIGEFYKAYKNFITVLEEYGSVLKDDLFARMDLLLAAISICNIVGAKDRRDQLYTRHESIYNGHIQYLHSNPGTGNQFLYSERMLEVVKDYKKVLQIIFFLPDNFYEEDVSEFIGITSIGRGKMMLIVDEQTDSLKAVSLFPLYNQGVRQHPIPVTITDNLSIKVNEQKELFEMLEIDCKEKDS